MIHCKACDGGMDMDTVKLGYGDSQVDTGQLEILCDRCLGESRRSDPEEYYAGYYHDHNAHPTHYVMSPTIVDLLEGVPGHDWKATAPEGAATE